MKLRLYYFAILLGISLSSFAQIGIGTNSPEPSSILDVESTTKGFLLPRVSVHTAVSNPAIGLMVYDLTDHCINIYIGDNTWKNLCETASNASITTIDCTTNPPEFNGTTMIEGTLVSGTSTFITVNYTGGNEEDFPSETITPTGGITGITATVDPGTLANGDGQVSFIITGTPVGSGTATFPISFLGTSNASCASLDVTVNPIQVTPPNYGSGDVSLSTKICFDIAISNDFEEGCGALALRTASQADFTTTATNAQTLTISTTGIAITDIAVIGINNATGNVILSVTQPATTSLGTNSSTTATINYITTLNVDALGKDHASRMQPTVYVTYKEAGVNKQSEISPFVKDCECGGSSGGYSRNSFLIDENGDLYTAGKDFPVYGSLGHSGTGTTFEKVEFPVGVKVTSTTEGLTWGAATGTDGKLYVWGGKQNGLDENPLGLTSISPNNQLSYALPTPHPLAPAGEHFVSVSTSAYGITALTESGKVYGGGNQYSISASGFTIPDALFHDLNAPANIVKIVHSWYGTIAITQSGDAYIVGFDEGRRGGLYSASGTSTTWTKLRDFNTSTNSQVDFPADVVDAALCRSSSVVLLQNGDIYVAGEYGKTGFASVLSVAGPGALGGSNTSGVTGTFYTTVFSKLIIDGDAAATMGTPIKVFMEGNTQGTGAAQVFGQLYVIDNNGDVYAKGHVGYDYWGALGYGPWGNSVTSLTFQKLNFNGMTAGDKIVNIITNDWHTMFVSANGDVFYTGRDFYAYFTGTSTYSHNNSIDKITQSYFDAKHWTR